MKKLHLIFICIVLIVVVIYYFTVDSGLTLPHDQSQFTSKNTEKNKNNNNVESKHQKSPTSNSTKKTIVINNINKHLEKQTASIMFPEISKLGYKKTPYVINPENYSSSSTSFIHKLANSADYRHRADLYTDFCRDVRHCMSPNCFAPEDYLNGSCEVNPFATDMIDFYRKSSGLTERSEEPKPKKPPRLSDAGYPYTEFVCSDRVDERDVYFDHGESEKRNKENDPLYKFKKHTSFMFNKWYDWSGKCVNNKPLSAITTTTTTAATASSSSNAQEEPATVETTSTTTTTTTTSTPENNNNNKDKMEEFEFAGFHDPKDGLYHAHNICLRPEGGYLGYVPKHKPNPRLDVFRGTNDVFHAMCCTPEDTTADWLAKQFERMNEPADCYLDTKVVMFPITYRIENQGHAWHRAGSLLRVIESFAGIDARDQKQNVTIGYFGIYHPITETKQQIMQEQTFHLFYDIVGTSWFSIFGYNWSHLAWEDHALRKRREREIYGFDASDHDLRHGIACFKEVVFWQDAYIAENPLMSRQLGFAEGQRGEDAADVPGRQTNFHIHGPRSARNSETLAILDSRLRACGKIPPRRQKIRSKNPRVALLIRSRFRRFSLQPYLIDILAKRFLQTYGDQTTFEVVEHTQMTYRQIIERFSDFDIAIGVYGAALVWTAFMPPGAIILEFNYRRYGFGHRSGINLDANGEYEGSAHMAQQYHMKITDHTILQRYPKFYGGIVDDLDLISGGTSQHYTNELIIKPISCLLTNVDNILSKQVYKYNLTDNVLVKRPFQRLGVPTECNALLNDNIVNGLARSLVDGLRREDMESLIARISSMRIPRFCSDLQHSLANHEKSLKAYQSLLAFPPVWTMLYHYRFSHRLWVLTREKEKAAVALAPFIFRTNEHESKNVDEMVHEAIDTTVAIIEPCAARARVWAEISALRQIAQRVGKVLIVEYSLGKEFCDLLETFDYKQLSIRVGGEKERRKRLRTLHLLKALRSFVIPEEGKSAKLASWREARIPSFYHNEDFAFCEYHCCGNMFGSNSRGTDWFRGHKKFVELILNDEIVISNDDLSLIVHAIYHNNKKYARMKAQSDSALAAVLLLAPPPQPMRIPLEKIFFETQGLNGAKHEEIFTCSNEQVGLHFPTTKELAKKFWSGDRRIQNRGAILNFGMTLIHEREDYDDEFIRQSRNSSSSSSSSASYRLFSRDQYVWKSYGISETSMKFVSPDVHE